MAKRVQPRPGDVFQIPLPNGAAGYGRVLLDLRRVARAGLFPPGNALAGLYGSGLLVQVYRVTAPEPLRAVEDLARAAAFLSEFVVRDPLTSGQFPVFGRLPVVPAALDFPEYVSALGMRFAFEKGAISVPIELGWADGQALPKGSLSLGLDPEAVERDIRDPSGAARRAAGDLRVDERRAGVLRLAGLRPDMTYDEMCAAGGGARAAELLAASE